MVNTALFLKELAENRIKFLISLFIMCAVALVIPLLYGYMGNLLGQIDLSPYLDQGEISFILSSYHNYAWSQWQAKNLTQLATLSAIVLGMGALAGETAYGTAPFLLSKPLTRRQGYKTKAAAGLILLGVVIFSSTLLLMLVSVFIGHEIQPGPFIAATLIVFAGSTVIYLGTVLCSALISDPVKAGVVAALCWGLLAVPGLFRGTVQYSIFYQMKAVPYWLQGDFPWLIIFIFVVLAYLFYEGGIYYWQRKDF